MGWGKGYSGRQPTGLFNDLIMTAISNFTRKTCHTGPDWSYGDRPVFYFHIDDTRMVAILRTNSEMVVYTVIAPTCDVWLYARLQK